LAAFSFEELNGKIASWRWTENTKDSSCDDEELLKVVTHVVARLQLDWPQEKEQVLKVRADQ